MLGTKTIDIHMSNNDDLDEVTKRILAEVKPDAQSGSDDSKESKSTKKVNKNDDYNEYEDDDRDPLQNKEMDDSDW